MPIPATKPTTMPASDAKTFDSWWLSSVALFGDQAVQANVTFRKYRVAGDGSNDYSPVDAPVSLNVPDVLNVAATRAAAGKPALATAVQALLTAAQELAGEQGLI